LKAKINIYTAGMFILLLIILNSLIFLLFSQMMLDNEVDRSYAEAVKTVKGISEAGEDVKTGELLRAYLPVEGMFKIVNEDGESTRTITDPELQHLKDFKTKYYDSEKYTTIKIGKDSYIFVFVPMITEKGEVDNLQLMESLESKSHILNIIRVILYIVTKFAMCLFIYSVHILSYL